MGVLRKRYDTWYIDLTINGRRIKKAVSKSKKLAELALKDYELKAERNELGFLDLQEISVKDFFEQFKEYSKVNHRQQTVKRYHAVIQHFLEYLKSEGPHLKNLSQITSSTFEKYKIHRRNMLVARNGWSTDKVDPQFIKAGAKAYTVNFELTTLRTILYLAVKWDYLKSNPAKSVKLLKTDDSKQRRFLSGDECKRLLESVSDWFYTVLYAFLNTGMRLSELINLEWRDVDFENRVIKIQRKSFWLPKTGERTIPMNDGFCSTLRELTRVSTFVFVTQKGKQLSDTIIRKRLIETAKKAEIDNLTGVHSLRHTFASQLLMKGADLPSVQRLMGHTSIETTMIYTHQTADHLQSAVAKLSF